MALSPERVGRITASRFHDVMVAPKSKAAREAGELSASARSYMFELLAETLTGESRDYSGDGGPAATQWGNRFEPYARTVYADLMNRDVTEPGFVTHHTIDRVGCTPDGLVGQVGGLEIKCPYNAENHLRVLIDRALPKQYVAQVQGSLWVTSREWWDFVSYDPRCERVEQAFAVVRVVRDEPYIAELERACVRLLDALDEQLECVRAMIASGTSTAHTVAHLIAPPIRLTWKGEEVRV